MKEPLSDCCDAKVRYSKDVAYCQYCHSSCGTWQDHTPFWECNLANKVERIIIWVKKIVIYGVINFITRGAKKYR